MTLLFIVAIFIFVIWAQSQQARQPYSGSPYGPYRRRAGYGGGPIFFPGDWGGGGGGGGGDGGGFSGRRRGFRRRRRIGRLVGKTPS